jgi:CubicO group peptidase (beta-lactamase class C family)
VRRLVGLAICVVGLLTLELQANDPDPQTLDEVEAKILSILQGNNTPGFIGALVIGDEVTWTSTLGMSDVTSQRAVVEDTQFRVVSISKTITALAAPVLLEQNVLTLDMILHTLIPEAAIGKAVWAHAQLVVTTANVIVLGYLSYYGLIGLRFWAD